MVTNRKRTKRAYYDIGGATMLFAATVKPLHSSKFTRPVFDKLVGLVRDSSLYSARKVQQVFGSLVDQDLTLYVIVTDRFEDVYRRRQQGG